MLLVIPAECPDSLSVADNMSIGSGYPSVFGTIRTGRLRAQVRHDLDSIGLDIDPESPVGSLTPALRAGVAIAA